MSALDDLLVRARDERGVTCLCYLHCDHFEPWRFEEGTPAVGDRHADEIEAFVATTAEIPYARRLTLFTKSPLASKLVADHPKAQALPGDEIGFGKLRRGQREAHARGLRAIVASGHELQLHIHHERFTRNDDYSTSPDRPGAATFRDFLLHRSTPEMDRARLRFHIALTLKLFRKATGLPFDRWMFVHGMWSLNGSDRDFCAVDDEIALLSSLGCRGDFTFPAPREHCNPAPDAPYLVHPVTAPKGYDAPGADIVPADGRAAEGRFFLWSSAVSARFCSLDTVSRSFASLSEDPLRWAIGLIDGAVERDGAIYVKTHAHSMMGDYFSGPRPIYPHIHPAVARLFDLLLGAAERAGLAFDPLTAGEAYSRFVAPDSA